MDGVLYSWLGTAACAPFVGLLASWTIVVFFNYRNRWRLVDIFLCSLTAHEVVFSLFGFGFAVLSIIRPFLDTPCSFMIWGLTATRLFHLSSLTSLLLDRALSCKFPYTYRYSIKKSQVQYHLAVLGIIAVFVGVTSVFARSDVDIEGTCSLHPLAWNGKFSIFMASVYGLLMLVGFVCCFVVSTGKKSLDSVKKCFPPVFHRESGRLSSTSSDSSRALKEDWDEQRDAEWRVVVSICWISYVVNHGPYMIMSIMGMLEQSFWNAWIDNIIIWTCLIQGILVHFVLFVTDSLHRNATKDMLGHTRPGRIYRHLSDHSGFRMQIPDSPYFKSGLSSPHMMCPSNYGPTYSSFQVPHRMPWTPNSMPSLHSFISDKKCPSTFCPSKDGTSKEIPRCISPIPPLNKDVFSSLDSSCYTLLSFKSESTSTLPEDHEKDIDEDSLSITTNALDDFEFHDGKPSSKNDGFINTDASYPNRHHCKSMKNENDPKSNLYSKQHIPNFSNNNLFFLSSKLYRGRPGSFSNYVLDNEKYYNNIPMCLELDASLEGNKDDPKFQQKQFNNNRSMSNEGYPSKHDMADKRLIIYSEYL